MKRIKKKQVVKDRRTKRIRAKIIGLGSLPRLSVFRSNKNIYVQLIDDKNQKTLVSASFSEVKSDEESKGMSARVAKAFVLGKLIAERAKKQGVEKVIFDRGQYNYHGRVKAIADGARKGGLIF